MVSLGLEHLAGASSIGIFGGTFDPIHTGHLILAERAREELGLDALLFMPANIPPHKTTGRTIGSGEARLEMVQLGIAENPAFHLTDLELTREGVSYTVDSLRAIRESIPEARLVVLIGSDNAREFTTWRQPEEIVRIAEVAVWARPDNPFSSEILPGHTARTIPAPLIEISSTEIRRRVAEGRSIRYLTPEPVISYIRTHGLYL